MRVPGGEVYSALEKGVVDGACWPAFGAFNYKWYEVAKWQVRPRFGETVHPLLVNVDSWNKLSPDLQKQVTEITLEVEEESRAKLMAAWQAEEQELVKLGMKLCVLPPDQAEKYLDTFYTATWNMVIKLDKENGPKLKELADVLFQGACQEVESVLTVFPCSRARPSVVTLENTRQMRGACPDVFHLSEGREASRAADRGRDELAFNE